MKRNQCERFGFHATTHDICQTKKFRLFSLLGYGWWHERQTSFTFTSFSLILTFKIYILHFNHGFFAIFTIRFFGNMLAQVLKSNFLKSIHDCLLCGKAPPLEIGYLLNYEILNDALFSHYSKL